MLHVMGLSTDQAAKVQNDPLSLIALSENGGSGVLEGSKFLLVALSLAFKLFRNLLLKNKSFEGIVTLLLSSRETCGKTSCIILLLVDETSETSVLALVVLNLDLEVLSLLCKLFGESLEFQELEMSAHKSSREYDERHTCCFQLSSSSTRKLFLFVTLPSSVSIRPLRLMKSCQASSASLEY
jgi:hypothetical protein